MGIYAEINEKIIEAIQKRPRKWIMPWNTLQRNGYSGRIYRLINNFILGTIAYFRNYKSNLWFTPKQIERLGGKLKEGARLAPVFFWKFLEVPDQELALPEDEETYYGCAFMRRKTIRILKIYIVYNFDEIEGIRVREKLLRKNEPEQKIELAEKLLKLPEIHKYSFAFYSPIGDFIGLPPRESFALLNDFYATFLHELVHWTGHESRLNRLDLEWISKVFFEPWPERELRAMEELVAELGSAYLCAYMGIPLEELQHASYIDAWLKIFRKDKRAFFAAAAKAQQACNWLLSHFDPEFARNYKL